MADSFPASTLTPTSVQAKEVATDSLALGAQALRGVSQSPDDNDYQLIASAKALFEGLQRLQRQIQEIDPFNNFFQDNTVVTLPLLPLTFKENGLWELSNWTVSDEMVTYVGGTGDNYIRVPNSVIQLAGHHFLVIEIDRLDSGKITVTDSRDRVLAQVDQYSKNYVEVVVSDQDTDNFRISATGVFDQELIRIRSIGFYRVTSRIRDYILYRLKAAGIGLSGADIDAALVALKQQLTDYTDQQVLDVHDALTLHLNDNNPHRITAAMIGAAPMNHTHDLAGLGVAPVHHTHQPEECGAAPASHGHTPASIGAASADHGHTPLSIGAASQDHTHTPASLGAANKEHAHTPDQCGAAPVSHVHSQYTTQADVTAEISNALSGIGANNGGFVTLDLYNNSLYSAAVASQTEPFTLLIDRQLLVTETVHLPDTLELFFLREGALVPNPGVVVYLENTRLRAGVFQIFKGEGQVVGTAYTHEPHLEWFRDKTAFNQVSFNPPIPGRVVMTVANRSISAAEDTVIAAPMQNIDVSLPDASWCPGRIIRICNIGTGPTIRIVGSIEGHMTTYIQLPAGAAIQLVAGPTDRWYLIGSHGLTTPTPAA